MRPPSIALLAFARGAAVVCSASPSLLYLHSTGGAASAAAAAGCSTSFDVAIFAFAVVLLEMQPLNTWCTDFKMPLTIG